MDEAIHPRWAEFGDFPGHPDIWIYPDREPRIRHQDMLSADLAFECPRCAYNLTGVSGEYCPECGIALAYEPVTVFTAADLSLAWAAVLVLDNARISNLLVSSSFDLGLAVLRRKSSYPRVLVPFKFFYEAADLLQREFGAREFGPAAQPIRSGPHLPPWRCSQCGEENPGTFEICWQCASETLPAHPD